MAKVLQSGLARHQFPLGEHRETKLNEFAPEARERFPFYFLLPYDDEVAMLKWRLYVRKRCVHDLEFRRQIWEMCRHDVCFFLSTFGVIFEPRPVARWLPFLPYMDQVSLLSWFDEIYGERSGATNKTRGIGMSWLSAGFIFHRWMFHDEAKIATLTKDKDLLDSMDANSSIGKLQYLYDHMPTWAQFTSTGQPKLSRVRDQHTFINRDNGAVIQGFVSTSTKLRQLRFTMIVADEFAFYDRTDQEEWVVSAGGTTDCMLLISTWNDFDDMFHHIFFEEESSLLKMSAFWWNNYDRWQGAYKIEAGRVIYVDKNYKHPPGYQFGKPDVLDDGMLRSPWVDAELSKPGKKRNILKALRDLYGMEVCSRTNLFFDQSVVAAVGETITEPTEKGTLDTSSGGVKILPTNHDDIRVWGDPECLDNGPYYSFCDLSHGVGAAYAVLCVLDKYGNQRLEYGTNTTGITEFARNVVLVCRWLAGKNGDGWVMLDFEANGMPKPFRQEITRLGYGNIHMSDRKSPRPGDEFKYSGTKNDDGGLANFRELERAVLAMETKITSDLVLRDMKRCGKDLEKGGKPKFPLGHTEGHGDFLQAYGGAWWRARGSVELAGMVEYTNEGPSSDPRHKAPWETTNERWSSQWE